MKFVGKLLLTLSTLVLLLLVVAYFVLQSSWAARQMTTWINSHSAYRVTLDRLQYDLRQPRVLQLHGISLAPAGHPPIVQATTLALTFGGQQFTTPSQFSAIRLSRGELTLSAQGLPVLPISAATLQLHDMQIHWPHPDWPLQASGVDGGIIPLQPGAPQVDFQFSAASLNVGDIPAKNLLLQGDYRDGQLRLNNLGADVANGQMTAQAQRQADGVWRIDNLRLSQIYWQSPQTLRPFLHALQTLPPLILNRLDLLGANLEGDGWALGGLDATLNNVTLSDGRWHSQQGSLAFNAADIVIGNLHLSDPLFNAELTPQGVTLRQFSTRWSNALISTTGVWQRDSSHLTLNDLTVVGLEYSLPSAWRTLWQRPLPAWLEGVTLDRFSLSRTLLVDINPDFPFQMTALDGFGNHVTLARQHRWGLWQGQMQFNASEATFNKVDLRRPSVTLQADDNALHISDFSAISQKGLLEANATLTRSDNMFALALHGRGVPVGQLDAWGWPALTTLQGDVNLQLTLRAPLQAGMPFRPGVDATLQAQDGQGQTLQQRMVQGALVAGK